MIGLDELRIEKEFSIKNSFNGEDIWRQEDAILWIQVNKGRRMPTHDCSYTLRTYTLHYRISNIFHYFILSSLLLVYIHQLGKALKLESSKMTNKF